MSETLPPGCYYHQKLTWRMIAASTTDDEGREKVDVAKLGQCEDDEEWRFRDRELADAWAAALDAPYPTPIADMPHSCNGWIVRIRQPIEQDAQTNEREAR